MSDEDQTPEPAVRITLTQVYHKLVEIENRLGDHPKVVDDHELRLRNLEMKVWGFAGLGSAVAVIISAFISNMG
jgi:hypothetical protein